MKNIVRRHDILMVDFGENKGSVQNGKRPAVVIQNDRGNKNSTTTIVVPITKTINNKMPTHCTLYKEEYTCLKYDSTILAEQVLTISEEQILDNMGSLNEKDIIKLNKILAISIDLKNKWDKQECS